MPKESFQARLKRQQVEWAGRSGIQADQTEAAQGRPWVLRPEYKAINLYDPSWWCLIEGKEHRWARALNSSQCFAVNLFAPMVEDRVLAREIYRIAYPDRELRPDDTVTVALEVTPTGTREWLGERGQPTQLDACFTVAREAKPVGYGLVEVKLSEAEFGSCRGARKAGALGKGNRSPDRCLDLSAVLGDPSRQCWLVEAEGRRYWDIMLAEKGRFSFDAVGAEAACPFGIGLYQPMRNAVLAGSLVDRAGVLWADASVCVHPENLEARRLSQAVCGSLDVIAAFNRMAPGAPIRELDPEVLVNGADEFRPELRHWASWMRERYLLPGANATCWSQS